MNFVGSSDTLMMGRRAHANARLKRDADLISECWGDEVYCDQCLSNMSPSEMGCNGKYCNRCAGEGYEEII